MLTIDHALWGKRPFGYHVTTLFIHIVAAVSLFFLARTMLPPANTIEVLFVNAEGSYTGSARILPLDGLERTPENGVSPAASP